MSLWPAWMRYTSEKARHPDFASQGANTHVDAASDVMTAIAGITLRGPKEGVVWRGQADEAWRLVSKAGREGLPSTQIYDNERAMIRKARRLGIDGAQRMGDWEILARLRHHGAITRLIDCSTDPFVALWFLCDDDSSDNQGRSVREVDGVLLAMKRSQFTEIDRPYSADTYEAAFDNSHHPARMLYATPPIDARIAAQRGVFAFYSAPESSSVWPESELGPLSLPSQKWGESPHRRLEKLCGPSGLANERGRRQTVFPDVIAVTVRAEVKPILLAMLEQNFGFTRDTMFPDFAGMGQYSSAVGV
ncbi:FRG domain-containing protein [Microbacterium oxydans]|uniref:FRG domain-containing protein n=1 Tax=Microbacterium oxydans TaxID=82380 RepID=UPI001476A53C|nr:FRG domain-containing protein [Microbacterium oxydans]